MLQLTLLSKKLKNCRNRRFSDNTKKKIVAVLFSDSILFLVGHFKVYHSGPSWRLFQNTFFISWHFRRIDLLEFNCSSTQVNSCTTKIVWTVFSWRTAAPRPPARRIFSAVGPSRSEIKRKPSNTDQKQSKTARSGLSFEHDPNEKFLWIEGTCVKTK